VLGERRQQVGLLLAGLDSSTAVTAPGATTVAGRAAYQLVLSPRDASSLVASVRLAVDAETKVPLRLQVMSTQIATPAIEVGFTGVDFATPEDRMFGFTAPPGTTVTEGGALGSHDGAAASGSPSSGSATMPSTPATPTTPVTRQPATGSAFRPKVVGTGWTTVVVGSVGSLPIPGLPQSVAGSATGSGSGSAQPAPTSDPAKTGAPGSADTLTRALAGLPRVSGDWGSGRVLAGTLFTVILTDDGRVAIGTVGADRLTAALAAK
jgi:hypothetical protein